MSCYPLLAVALVCAGLTIVVAESVPLAIVVALASATVYAVLTSTPPRS